MAKVRDVAAEEIKQIDQLFETSGKTFRCTENKHAWEAVKGGGRPAN